MPPSTSRPIPSTSYSPNMTLASIFYVLFVIQALPYSCQQDEDIPHNEVRNWALKFGVDLWEFGKQFTKINEIQQKYNSHAAEVSRKDGLILIREMANEVKNMIDIKKNAIMRIMEYAEHAALSHRIDPETTNLKYVNSKNLGKKQNANLEMNRHFDQRYVNVTRSSVIIPKFLNENDPAVVNALSWSENLDSVFVNNYEMDPGLSWQYFGSSTGFIRKFPATQWPPEDQKNRNDMHDFRSSSWYVGASTSPKDLAILIDNSNTLNSKAFDLVKTTVKAIINTVGDDDFINVYAFAETTKEIVTCFKDVMVQGTSVNKRELIYAIDNLMMESGSNFSAALVTGFEILQKYNKSGEGSQCNQALMLVTGSAKGDYAHLIKGYNQPHTPVRIFTYNVVKDSSNAAHLYSIACTNKGYYEYIQSKDDIKEKVLNYLRVMSRPMVMYQNKHPIHWTPVYTGGKANSLSPIRGEEGQLMTTVSTPIFDRRNTSVRSANLLGVVGTDIPIQQIKKLIPPYKLGANGYSFIVNNNGHVLYHPDLRPLYSDNLKPIYNSVDLSSVEMLDNMANPYENNTLLSDLRQDMINQKEGETEIKVKIHYDDMKRVSTRKNKYFYHPIHGTPFSLGISLPDGYGMYEVLAEQEIKLSQINVLEYFKGNNWRVHPDWIYCEYNYANEHTFQRPEEQLLHFLGKTKQPGWKWMSLRPRSILKQHGGDLKLNDLQYISELLFRQPLYSTYFWSPSMKKVEKDSYYCDKSLMQSLVFDAMVTDGFGKFNPSSVKEQQGYQMFGQTLTFIATRSGLFRWQDHTSKHQYEKYFADMNQNSIDEAWYKRAVDHHNIEPESFVFSVPFESEILSGTTQSTFVTATHAVFLEHKGHKAPAAVVGLQFQHSTLAAHFLNITSGCTGNSGCKKTCASEDLDCYVLDNNGFIIISEKSEHTGKFFGYADGTIMDSLVQDGVYKKVPIVDFQGACTDSKSRYSSADKLNLDTLKQLMWLFNWAFSKFIWLCAKLQLHVLLNVHYIVAQEDIDGPIYSDYESSNIDYGEGLEIKRIEPTSRGSESDDKKSDPLPGNKESSRTVLEETNYRASGQTGLLRTSHARHCTKTVDLYVLQPSRLNNSGNFNPLKGKLTNCHITGCERPFSVQKIPHSNLILLVVDTLCPCGSKQLSISAQEIVPEEVGNVCRGDISLYRSRDITDPKCINYHPEEIMIKQCGGSSTIQPILALLFFTLFTIFHFS